jgi:hypothetical protein
MFAILDEATQNVGPNGVFHRPNMVNGGIPAPPPTYVPPVGSSFNTWPNVYTNLKNIDYCTDQFNYIT